MRTALGQRHGGQMQCTRSDGDDDKGGWRIEDPDRGTDACSKAFVRSGDGFDDDDVVREVSESLHYLWLEGWKEDMGHHASHPRVAL